MAKKKPGPIFNLHLRDGTLVRPATTLTAVSGQGEKGTLFGMVEKDKTGILTPDQEPTFRGEVPATSGGIYEAIRAKSNPNLLDNWYFGRPVNQRGKTEYRGKVQTIDRWKSINERMVLTVEDGFIKLKTNGNGTAFLRQVLYMPGQDGMTLTASCMAKGSEPGHVSILQLREQDLEEERLEADYGHFPASETWTVGYATHTLRDCKLYPYVAVSVRHDNNPVDGELDLLAVKLEAGDRQTLARQGEDGAWIINDAPPDWGDTLTRCQRYQVNLLESEEEQYLLTAQAKDATTLYALYVLPVPMLNRPTLEHSIQGIHPWKACGLFMVEDIEVEMQYAEKAVIYDIELAGVHNGKLILKLTGEGFLPGYSYSIYTAGGEGQKLFLDGNTY